MNKSQIKVGIICPLDDEYNACKEILGLKNESELFGRVFSERKEENIEVYAIKAGVGKINCSSATQLVSDRFHTDFVIDAGVAGSLIKDLDIFDIVCAEHCYDMTHVLVRNWGKYLPGMTNLIQ